MSIQIYILSKLMEENTYPYKLKKELSEPIPFDKFGNLTESKLYYHFDALTKQGLIEHKEVIKEENRPDKQVFGITNKGREQLPLKIYASLKKANTLVEMLVVLMFLRHVEKDKVLEILRTKRAEYTKKEQQFQVLCEQLESEDVARQQPLVGFATDYLSERITMENHWLDGLITKLEMQQ